MQTKEKWDVELEGITPHSLGDGVWPILEWVKLTLGSNEALLMHMYSNFVTHLELVRHSMLIMAFLVLSIGSIQYIMDLLQDVLNVLNEAISHVNFRLDVS